MDGDTAGDAAVDSPEESAPIACKSFQTQCDTRCVDLTSDPNDCGVCNRVCPGAFHASPACTLSVCSLVCDQGWTDCDHNPSDGCETNLQTDPNNCSSCGGVCPAPPNALATCTKGTCGVGACNPGFADCNMLPGDGCEAKLGDDPSNCGSCGNVCPNGEACSNGACGCNGGGTVCNGTCADTSTDRNNCGTCGNVCASAQTCISGTCTCPSGSPNLCGSTCTNLQTDFNNCGTCGHSCNGTGAQICSAGACGCYGGYMLCNGTCIYPYNDPKNCGGCGHACATGQSCNVNTCVCPSSAPTLCNSGCADLQSDPNNCGTCGNVCTGATGTCTAGACVTTHVTLASGQASPGAIALDKAYVYWVDDASSGSVMRVAKTGGGVTTLVQNEPQPYALALDATNVYFTDSGSSVKKVPLGGAPSSTVIATQSAYGLALSGSTLLVGSGDLEAIPTSGGSLTLLATGQNQPRAVTADASNVYWITTSGVVASVPITGGTMPTTLTSGQSGYSGIAVDASNVYWTNSAKGTIVSVPIGGGGFTTLATGQTSASGIAVAGGYVYWTTNTSAGTVMKLPVGGGGTPIAIATGQNYPLGVAVDDTYVYWTDSSGYYGTNGTVMKTLR
jgi:hypothetical protein